ncbi:butyrophilin-like protein 1 [Misgurnus anguillicaudatus]|uniref:butyrophilin-like protein 1 n=1 Tax=Misgurnus anguillicaudatus TaxID=75329 RepID=UPI003CCFB17C
MATASSNEFQLVVPETAQRTMILVGTEFSIPCHLSPEISAVDMEIRWFKETDCVCIYKNREIIEGRVFKGRVNLITEKLEKGDVSLSLKNFRESDRGDYVCQVTSGVKTEEITVTFSWAFGGFVWLMKEKVNRTWTENEKLKMEDSVLMAGE